MAEESLDHGCPEPLINIVSGDSLTIVCPRCGWSVATSYLAFVWKDETTYWLSIASANPEDRERLGRIARVFGDTPSSILEGTKLGVLPIKSGSAYTIRHDALALRDAGVVFNVDPAFPWRLSDGSSVEHVPNPLTPLAADETLYRVSVVATDRRDRAQLGTLVRIFGGSLGSLYRAIGAGLLPSKSGPALAVRGDIFLLRAAGIAVDVEPSFPWRLADGSLVADVQR